MFRQKATSWHIRCLRRYFSAWSDNNIVCQWMNIAIWPAKQNIGAASVRAYYLIWKGWFIHTIRITCSLWNWHWKDDLVGSLLYYLNSGFCWPARILRSTRPFQMCCPCPDKCNWSLWCLVGTCWRRRTTTSTAHGCRPSSQTPKISRLKLKS